MLNEIDQGQLCLNCDTGCKGFEPHSWRNICRNCKCGRESHDIRFKDYIEFNERLQLDERNMERLHLEHGKTKKFASLEQGYTWRPAGLTPKECETFFENYPDDRIPRLGTSGEKWREKALMFQMPKQDISKDFCKFLSTDLSQKKYSDYLENRNSQALDIGICHKNVYSDTKCKYCDDLIRVDDLYVHASTVNNDVTYEPLNVEHDILTNNWHPGCFKCTVCDELLVDLVYCIKNNQIYCVRHYGETMRPRCFSCDEVSVLFFTFTFVCVLLLAVYFNRTICSLKTKNKTQTNSSKS